MSSVAVTPLPDNQPKQGGRMGLFKKFKEAVGKAVGGVVGSAGRAAEDAANAAKKAAEDAARVAAKTAEDTAREAMRAADNAAAATAKAAEDLARATAKAADDAGRASAKAQRDVLDAGRAAARFAERNANAQIRSISDAERRLREGKVADALWHAAIDPVRAQEQNAAKAAQESLILRTVGQVAASTYGGPGGTAAFAAWYTYRTTGDAEMAVRVGLISGATSAGLSATAGLPMEGVAGVAARASISGALGGLAVAAAGGDANAVREGFLRSGAMVLIQDGYREFTSHSFDTSPATKEPLDLYGLEDEYFLHDESGAIRLDQYGKPMVDYSKIDHHHSLVGKGWGDPAKPTWMQEHHPVMKDIARLPGMNAMAMFHDSWVVSWDMNTVTNITTIPPAVVVTYMGTEAPVIEQIRKAAGDSVEKKNTPDAS